MIRGRTFVLAATAIAAAFYGLQAQAEAWALKAVFDLDCRTRLWTLACDYPADAPPDLRAYIGLGIVFAGAIAVSFAFCRRMVGHVFTVMIAGIGLIAVSYDVLAGQAVIHAPKLINDTMNVLSFALFASFLLTFLILRRAGAPLLRIVLACAISYGVKLWGLLAFEALQQALGGATELFLLYVIYAFGVFGLHMMTISGLFLGLPLTEKEIAA